MMQEHAFLRKPENQMLPIIIEHNDHDHWSPSLYLSLSDGKRLPENADEQSGGCGWHCSSQVLGSQVKITQTRGAAGFQVFLAWILALQKFTRLYLILNDLPQISDI